MIPSTRMSRPPGGEPLERAGPFAVLGNRNFRLYWSGQAISLVGTWMQVVAQSFVVVHGVIVFFLQIDTLPQKNSSRDKHLQNRLSETPCAFGAD